MIERILRAISRNPLEELKEQIAHRLQAADEALAEQQRHISRMESLVELRKQQHGLPKAVE